MRILQLTAGAAGMYCGTCLRDNSLATALLRMGHDVTLVPLYTPTLTDEANVSQDKIFFGGISVYLEQNWALFRNTPWLLDQLWDSKRRAESRCQADHSCRAAFSRRDDRFDARSGKRPPQERASKDAELAGSRAAAGHHQSAIHAADRAGLRRSRNRWVPPFFARCKARICFSKA